MMAEPYRKKPKGRPLFALLGYVIAALILGTTGWTAYRYGPAIYYQFSGDAIVRLQKRIEGYEARFLHASDDPEEYYAQIEDIRRILNLVERENPAQAEVQYFQGILDFYELTLRVRFDGESLVQLTGRGYLPPDMPGLNLPVMKTSDLAHRASRRMRRALALSPDFKFAASAGMVISYGDLLFTGRTDPVLFDLMKKVKINEMPESYRPMAVWMSLALFALQGRRTELLALSADLEKLKDTERHRILPGPDALKLVVAHGALQAKDYLLALDLARKVRADDKAPDPIRAEAVRVEAEVFLAQNGPDAARPYFEEAKKIAGGKDPFLDERIKAISEKPKR